MKTCNSSHQNEKLIIDAAASKQTFTGPTNEHIQVISRKSPSQQNTSHFLSDYCSEIQREDIQPAWEKMVLIKNYRSAIHTFTYWK